MKTQLYGVRVITVEYFRVEATSEADVRRRFNEEVACYKASDSHLEYLIDTAVGYYSSEDKDFMMVIKPSLIQDAVKKAFKRI